MQFGSRHKLSEVCEVCEVEAIVREMASEPDRLCDEEKMFVFVIVMTIQFAILWVYEFYIDANYSTYNTVLNRRCENIVSWHCPREDLGCRSTSPGSSSWLTVRFMGGKGILDGPLQRIRRRECTIAREILFGKGVRCERKRV